MGDISVIARRLSLIKARLGNHKLRELLPIHINRMQDSLVKDGYSLSQIRKCRAMLIQIFDAADNNNLVVQNPARKAKILRDKDGSLDCPRGAWADQDQSCPV